MAPICGIPAETIRDGRAPVRDLEGLDDPVGHGHLAARARHRQRALPDRAVADDRPDRPARHRPASAARPEQRAGRVRRRPDPDDVPGLPARRRRRDARAGSSVSGARSSIDKPGLTVVEIMDAVHAGEIRGMYIMGENPAMSDPDVHHARAALADARDAGGAGHLPDRDRLSRRRRAAGLGASRRRPAPFTNTDRLVQLGRQALDPPGERAQDLVDHPARSARGWASTGTTRIRARCSTRCARACRRSPASPGTASSASRP